MGRMAQVDWLRQQASDLYHNSTYTAQDALDDEQTLEEYARDLAAFWKALMKDGVDEQLPEWYNDHDRILMEDMILRMVANSELDN